MLNTNSVVFKGRKDGIVILLDEKIGFDELKEIFSEKMVDARKFFGGRKTPIVFQGRELSEEQEAELLQILSDEANVNISFFSSGQADSSQPDGSQPDSSQTKTDKSAGLGEAHQKIVISRQEPEESQQYQKQNPYQQSAIFNTGSLRSGQSINHPGTVVVIGDVNPGAEIVAEGNIIVLGVLKGFVHAGSSGDSTCFVYANDLSPVQLRIADFITVLPKVVTGEKRFLKRKKKTQAPLPSRAYVSEGQIYIAQI